MTEELMRPHPRCVYLALRAPLGSLTLEEVEIVVIAVRQWASADAVERSIQIGTPQAASVRARVFSIPNRE